MDEESFDNDADSTKEAMATETRDVSADEISEDDDSYKSCADPSSHAHASSQDDKQETDDNSNEVAPDTHVPCPPSVSDCSAESFSENGSDDVYYSEIDNYDSDISNPARENTATNEIEISFQRELLEYLGSFFNVESRMRMREVRQSANLTSEQLGEYEQLRDKVDRELKVMGVGNSRDLASSDQNIARNLYFLLAARERGDWTSCRRYSRAVPMWSFEKRTDYAVEHIESHSSLDEQDGAGGRPKKRKKLVFVNTRKVRYLGDNCRSPTHSPVSHSPTLSPPPAFHEPVRRQGAWDIKSAICGSRWAVRRLGLETRFYAHSGCVNALNFSSSGLWLASGSDDRHLVITDWQQRRQLSRFTVGHSNNVFQARFLPGSGDLELVSCSRDATVRYAALSSCGQLQYSRLLAKHNGVCHKLDVPLDQPCLVLSAGEDACVLASDVRAAGVAGKLCQMVRVPFYTIACSPVRSQELAVAGKDSHVFLFDRRRADRPFLELCPSGLAGKPRSSYHVTAVRYGLDGDSILASYNDDDIYLLAASTASLAANGPTLHRYHGHRNVQTVTGVSFYGPDQEFVISGSNDGHVLIWERETEALVNWFRADENGVVNILEAHPTMPVLATAGLDHDIKLWSMLAADGSDVTSRQLPLERPLLELDAETCRIDSAWSRLEKTWTPAAGDATVPFDLYNLRVITALNWKMRDDLYPYSIDNNLDNLIFMSQRRRGDNQFRDIFISDSDSAESYDSVPDLNTGPATDGAPNRSSRDRSGADASRPDGCRSS